MKRVPSSLSFFARLKWIDGSPLKIDPYRRRIFAEALDAKDRRGQPRYNLVLTGRAKKNFKSADLILAALYRLFAWQSPNGNQCYLLANDEGQAGDDLDLAVKIILANPALHAACTISTKEIKRKDGRGSLLILPAQDVKGSHGKTYSFTGLDEIHGYRDWDLLEAMQLDPTRSDSMMWVTSYASLHHRPGVPLHDLMQRGKAGGDPRMFFSWYAADFTTDPLFADATPEDRANPSRPSWAESGYLEQQQRRLPAHKFRRLHLNLPGLPEGSAFQPDPVMHAIDRARQVRTPEDGLDYSAFVDMSGGSSDDAVLAVGYRDADERAVVCRVLNQGPPPPFDPIKAVERFVGVLKEYGLASVTGDKYAGETFKVAFEERGIVYRISEYTKSQLYESFEPALNSQQVILPNVPELEQQLLGLIWRGGKIDHPAGEHDDYANAATGAVHVILGDTRAPGDVGITLGQTDDPDYQGASLTSTLETHNGVNVVEHAEHGCPRCLARVAELRS